MASNARKSEGERKRVRPSSYRARHNGYCLGSRAWLICTKRQGYFGRMALGMLRLFAGLLGLVFGLTEIATATAQTVDGRNVTSVQVATGRFTMTGPQRWLERRDDGKTFNFVEVRRDQWSVYLLDSSRGVNLKIDLSNKQIFYSDTNSPLRSLYPIVGATAAPSQAPLAPLAKAAPPKTRSRR